MNLRAQSSTAVVEVTEDSVAREFSEAYALSMRYDHDAGYWFEFRGDHWEKDRTQRAYSYCRELARQASDGKGPRERASAGKASFAGGVERLARADPLHAVTADIWDSDPWLLGCPCVTVDLRDGKEREPDSDDGITRLTAVAPMQADCPLWRQFLSDATGGLSAVSV